ncbi:hypothetical protein JYU34_002666 [Plutella xylostella]|uniref:Uncharacterized protein n=3 Tax=Plutella xylostella TaxID=51655 RepID=A0ABQ7R2U5_PLUXY|nr:FAD-dependent oxidoreductase domain-containing protein 1 [Plutella xylostella]KAG7311617.1 hypothetical protein JYU34_002666 [Plutella xylostella]CAG9099655.1 unnamed protein product [Plutella xylostella]
MFHKSIKRAVLSHKTLSNFRQYSKTIKQKHPLRKTLDIIKGDFPSVFGKKDNYLEHADIVIIGGGIIGSSIAYWLKTRAGRGLSVAVIEKDLTFKKAQQSSTFSLNQHFSLPENILLSQYGAEFYRNFNKNMFSNVDIEYCPHGYLVLASEKYAENMQYNVTLQREHGVRNELLSPQTIKRRYPWINTEDVALGCVGTELEGTFNSWSVLNALVQRCKDMGTVYMDAEVTGFELQSQRDVMMEGVPPGSFKRIYKVQYTSPEGKEMDIKFASCILAAGAESANIAKMADVGIGKGLLSIPLPIKSRKQNIYTLKGDENPIGIGTPLIQDSSGLWFKRNGLMNETLVGHLPLSTVDSNISEQEYFDTVIKQPLENRVPVLKNAEIINTSTECTDYNTYDDTAIVGPHPYHNNLVIAAGFGGLAYQHAPGIGRAIAELIIDSRYINIELTRLHFDRLLTSESMVELNIY